MIENLLMLLGAYALALPMAIEREKRARSAGLRTFPLVAMASCGFVLVGPDLAGETQEAASRVLVGLMTGIGFIGGGAILKSGEHVRGLATAASLWCTGAVGAAVGFGAYDIAVALSLATAATLYFTPLVKDKVEKEPEDESDA